MHFWKPYVITLGLLDDPALVPPSVSYGLIHSFILSSAHSYYKKAFTTHGITFIQDQSHILWEKEYIFSYPKTKGLLLFTYNHYEIY